MITVEKLDAGLFGVNLISLRPPRRSVHRDRPTTPNLCPEGPFQPSVPCVNSVPTQRNSGKNLE